MFYKNSFICRNPDTYMSCKLGAYLIITQGFFFLFLSLRKTCRKVIGQNFEDPSKKLFRIQELEAVKQNS